MNEGESYFDIVWRQFKKNRLAYYSIWPTIGLFLIAITAPLLASNIPFVYHEGGATLHPWFTALFNPSEPVDFFFNMMLVALPFWVVAAIAGNVFMKRAGVSGRRRLGVAIASLFAATLLLITVFSLKPGWKPLNEYGMRDFPTEEFQSHGSDWGFYPPIPFGPTEQDVPSRFQPPGFRVEPANMIKSNQSHVHWLGTVRTGEDVLASMIYGTRISMTVGVIAVSIYMTIGIIVGALAGYFGGAVDMVISRIIEIVLLFPAFFLILTLVGLLGPSIYIIMLVIGITGWPGVARLIRGEVLKQRSLDYTLAAQSLGAQHIRIAFRHILPNSMSPALVSIPFGIAGAIVTEAGLSVLGFGVKAPIPTWGSLLNIAHDDYHNWWLIVFPSIAIFVTVTLFNLIGNALRDAMDPRLRI
jgi:peptide/nickel transport system permease protein